MCLKAINIRNQKPGRLWFPAKHKGLLHCLSLLNQNTLILSFIIKNIRCLMWTCTDWRCRACTSRPVWGFAWLVRLQGGQALFQLQVMFAQPRRRACSRTHIYFSRPLTKCTRWNRRHCCHWSQGCSYAAVRCSIIPFTSLMCTINRAGLLTRKSKGGLPWEMLFLAVRQLACWIVIISTTAP